jgi:hypothetical protein
MGIKNYWLDQKNVFKVGEEVIAVIGVPYDYLGDYCTIIKVRPFFAKTDADKRSFPGVNAFYYVAFNDGFSLWIPSSWINKL